MSNEETTSIENQKVKIRHYQEADVDLQVSQPIKHRRKYGNVIPLFFRDGEPLIVIGPNCK